jgi:hypothetical protein
MPSRTETPAAFLRRVRARRYKLKPATWKHTRTREAQEYTAESDFASLYVFRFKHGATWGPWQFEVYFSEFESIRGTCASETAGKAETEKLLTARILKHLTAEKPRKNAGGIKKSRIV